jgi:hypothetical protein
MHFAIGESPALARGLPVVELLVPLWNDSFAEALYRRIKAWDEEAMAMDR